MKSGVEVFALTAACLLIGFTGAVDILNGERVGGCPSSINNSSPRTYDECQVDTDCATNDLHKCCRNEFGIKGCVNPIPACRDGRKLREYDILSGTCEEQVMNPCVDRLCEEGPKGPGGWTAACCGGDAFDLWGGQLPSCKGGTEPLTDSEGEYFWCGSNSVRSCPGHSKCFTDSIGYRVCCPSSISASMTVTPDTTKAAPVTATPTVPTTSPAHGYPDCSTVRCADPECPVGYIIRHRVEACCEYDCIPPGCIGPDSELIPIGHSYTSPTDPCKECHCKEDGHYVCSTNTCETPKCNSDETLLWTEGSCCEYECVKNPIALLHTDGSLSDLCIIIIFFGILITLGIVITLTTLCYYKKKNHKKDNDHLQNYYNDLKHSTTTKEQKTPEKLEKIYETLGTIKMNESTNNELNCTIEKEKEGLENVYVNV